MINIHDLYRVNKDNKYVEFAKNVKEWLEGIDFSNLFFPNTYSEVFFQGSYSRRTNSQIDEIDEKSDIDIVLNFCNIICYDLLSYENEMKLINSDRIFFTSVYNPINSSNKNSITFDYFKNTILNTLFKNNINNYRIDISKNCLKISNDKYTVDVAILNSNISLLKENSNNNTIFSFLHMWDNKKYKIKFSFPTLNTQASASKQSRCGHFYEYVRVIKNIFKMLKNKKYQSINWKLSSYSIECLLYRLSDNFFVAPPNWINVLDIVIAMFNNYWSGKSILEMNDKLWLSTEGFGTDIKLLKEYIEELIEEVI